MRGGRRKLKRATLLIDEETNDGGARVESGTGVDS